MSIRLRSSLAVVACSIALAVAPPASAACHEFTISVSPATVSEGGTVTVTVERDGAFAPSQVEVASINESATGGKDYATVRRIVAFTNGTQETFTVATIEDGAYEGSETFRLHLGNGDGCLPTSEFTYGPDARITIANDDPSPSPRPQGTTSPTPRPTFGVSPTSSPTPAPTFSSPEPPTPIPTPEFTPSDTPTLPEPTSSELAVGPGDRGPFSPGRVALMVIGALSLTFAAGGLFALYRGRPQL